MVLETLCFDMGIEQPWVVLRRSIRGIDDLQIATDQRDPGTDGGTEGAEKRQDLRVTEAIVAELGWSILNEM